MENIKILIVDDNLTATNKLTRLILKLVHTVREQLQAVVEE
jgi:hypothetical protein